ncbi:MAG: LPS assembly lipoprotein LptE [Mangrovibacterium sp.]
MTYLKIMKNKLFLLAILIYMTALPFSACKMSYSFTGAALDPAIKSFTVYTMQNRARLVNPNLAQLLTEGMIDRVNKQTSLQMLKEDGHLEFEGIISDYRVSPVNISSGDQAAQSRLTVTVQVKFTNNIDHEEDWEKSFSSYVDFDANKMLSEVEDEVCTEIITQLTEDIFNASIANW